MSEEIYANPDEVRGDKWNGTTAVDNDGDIYDDVGANEPETRDGVGCQQSVCPEWRSWSGAAAVCLRLLCLLLLAGIIGLAVSYTRVTAFHRSEMQNIKTKYKNLTEEQNQLQTSYTQLAEDRDQLQRRYNIASASRDELQTQVDQLKLKIRRCPQGWKTFGDSCYLISTSADKNWEASRRDCQDRGADLVIINGGEERAFLKENSAVRAWIGLSDKHSARRWQWVDGTGLEGVGFWQKGEPNNRNENCVELIGNGWNDMPCSMTQSWICEM